MMWDAVFQTARHRNRRSTDGESGAPQTWRTVNDDSADRLPLAPKEQGAALSPPVNNQSTAEMVDSSWMEPWNAYVTDFGVGAEQFDMLDIPVLSQTEADWSPHAT